MHRQVAANRYRLLRHANPKTSAPYKGLREGAALPSGQPEALMAAARRPHGALPLAALRHTPADVLPSAVQHLFPEERLPVGPAIETGFYYDFDRAEPFTPEDLGRLEGRMKEIVSADYPMTGRQATREEAIAHFKGNPYKVEIAREVPEGEPITLYTIGDFTDLCRGGHAPSPGESR